MADHPTKTVIPYHGQPIWRVCAGPAGPCYLTPIGARAEEILKALKRA